MTSHSRQDLVNEIEMLTKKIPPHLNPDEAFQKMQAAMNLLHGHRPYYHWVGIYGLIDEMLYLGPFCGPPTDHVEIPVGRGVCGTAVKQRSNQRIDDVSSLDNYLACNIDTKSELVVLIWNSDRTQILGQIDVDGSRLKAFDSDEEEFLNKVAELLSQPLQIWLGAKKITINHHQLHINKDKK